MLARAQGRTRLGKSIGEKAVEKAGCKRLLSEMRPKPARARIRRIADRPVLAPATAGLLRTGHSPPSPCTTGSGRFMPCLSGYQACDFHHQLDRAALNPTDMAEARNFLPKLARGGR